MNPAFIPFIVFGAMLIGAAAIGGWIYTTRLRIKHGYPLETQWGKPVYPQKNEETVERVRLLSQENAQLRAELGSIKDRLATVERIVTDRGHLIADQIEALGRTPN